MKDRIIHSNCEFINPIEVEVRLDTIMIREDIKAGLGQTMCAEDVQDTIKITEAGQDMIPIIEAVTDIIKEVTKGKGDIIMVKIIEGVVIEIKMMTERGVGHMTDRKEMEETAEA